EIKGPLQHQPAGVAGIDVIERGEPAVAQVQVVHRPVDRRARRRLHRSGLTVRGGAYHRVAPEPNDGSRHTDGGRDGADSSEPGNKTHSQCSRRKWEDLAPELLDGLAAVA